MNERTRGEILLDHIYDEVDQRLNPDGEDCSYCGGEGYTHDCIDGFCLDAEEGCEDCTRRCPECALHTVQREQAVRHEVIKSGDVDIAIAWLKGIGRWRESTTPEQVKAEMASAAAALVQTRNQGH